MGCRVYSAVIVGVYSAVVVVISFVSHLVGDTLVSIPGYGVATIGRLLQIIGLFCKRALYKRPYSAKETFSFKEPTSS